MTAFALMIELLAMPAAGPHFNYSLINRRFTRPGACSVYHKRIGLHSIAWKKDKFTTKVLYFRVPYCIYFDRRTEKPHPGRLALSLSFKDTDVDLGKANPIPSVDPALFFTPIAAPNVDQKGEMIES